MTVGSHYAISLIMTFTFIFGLVSLVNVAFGQTNLIETLVPEPAVNAALLNLPRNLQ